MTKLFRTKAFSALPAFPFSTLPKFPPAPSPEKGPDEGFSLHAVTDDKSLSLLDDCHRKLGMWAIDTVNPNSWSSGAMSGAMYMELSAADVILTQEVKMPHGYLRDQAEQAARNSKWSLAIEPCEVTQLGGHSAGTSVAVRSFIGMSEPVAVTASKHLHAQGHFSMKRVSAMGKGGVHCGTPYLHSMVGKRRGQGQVQP